MRILLLCLLLSVNFAHATPFDLLTDMLEHIDEKPLAKNSLNSFDCFPNTQFSCSGHGTCLSAGIGQSVCSCSNNWDNQNCPNDQQCCNELKSWVNVFLAAFFGGFTGAPYFLIGATGLGVGILVMCLGGVIMTTVGKCFNNTSWGSLMLIVGCLVMVATGVWHLATWIMVATHTQVFNSNVVGPVP
jgi:hypothetical protein